MRLADVARLDGEAKNVLPRPEDGLAILDR